MSNIAFVGGFFPKQIEKDIGKKSKKSIQNAANVFQWAFINGIEENLSSPINLITAPFLGYFPQFYTSLFIKSFSFSHKGRSEDFSVGFCNLPVIKNFQKYFGLKRSLKSWASKISGDKFVIVYSLDLAYLKAAISLKKKDPTIHVCLIITDLPEYPGDSGIMYKLYIKYFEKRPVYNTLIKADSFVVLTDKMVDHFNLHNKPWVRIEGLYNFNIENPVAKCSKKSRILMYSGTLDARYGIENLLNAFDLVRDEDLQLWVCGGGMGKLMVERCAQKDKRIKYFGILPHSRVKLLQMEATVLINPRNTSGTYNKYSFPSKTMEYFASGTPAILYKLEGIPDEYFMHCYSVPGNSIVNLAETITTVCNLDQNELDKKGEAAKAFIRNNKSAKAQCERVLKMIYNF